MLAAQDALEPVCKRVAADDPYESYHDYGYRIIGYLRDNDLGAQAAYVYLSFDADGMLTDVDYTSQIDPEASLADNLVCTEQDIATLCAPRSTGWTFPLPHRASSRHAACRMNLNRHF